MPLNMLPGLVACALLAAACTGQPKSDAGDPYAGLTEAIHAWKDQVAAGDKSCKSPEPGQKCEMFDISCKAERVISPGERAEGVTRKVVADMTWSGFDDKGAAQPASAAALFVRSQAGDWARRPYKAVNPESCADL